jgi:hypothetical protein
MGIFNGRRSERERRGRGEEEEEEVEQVEGCGRRKISLVQNWGLPPVGGVERGG